ncbi:MAG TPA: SIMPL domain-containing protein [Planctomycetota bacterium]|nr:SIMPL domain-containing protein [Planctomycetota bacterium]
MDGDKVTASGAGHNRLAMFLLGATLALGFALSAYMVAGALVRMRQADTIRVKGTAQTNVTSDLAEWGGNFTVRSPELKAGYETLEKHREAVRQFLAKRLRPEEFSFFAVDISQERKKDENGNDTGVIENYVLKQGFGVSSANVGLIKELSRSITDLIRDGIEISSGRPEYTYSGIEKLKLDLLGQATRNAHERARLLADNGGGRVGSLASASQGIFQITSANSTDVSDSGTYDTSTIEKTVRAVVTLEFHVSK